MTAEIVNLRRVRKAKERTDREARADVNRARFGRTKAERQGEAARSRLAERQLDAHKRGEPDEPGPKT